MLRAPFLLYNRRMDAAIPQHARETLERFLPPGTPWDIDLQYRRILATVPGQHPSTLGPAAVMAVTLPRAVRALKAIGRSLAGVVFLHPDFGNLDTAAGIALLGHEMVHQNQYVDVPNFEQVYGVENRNTPPDMPWLNRFEEAAYMKEREIYCQLVSEGVPKGNWMPLGVQVWGC